MSRCFPFPPPGYEKKARLDVENLLEKEKQKEKDKKEKKEKKEKKKKKDKKEKKKDREGKPKKDKERSEDKHREKKDQKEKHKDKNKHTEKEEKWTSDEKNTLGPIEYSNGENTGSNCTQSNKTSELKFLVELGKRIRDDNKATENSMVQKINIAGNRSAELPGKVLKDNRDDDRMVYEQSNKVDSKCNEKGPVPNFSGGDERKVERVAGLVDKYVEKRTEQKKNDKHKNSDSKGDRHNDCDRDKKSKSKDEKRENKVAKEEKIKVKEPKKEQLHARENSVNAVCYNNKNKPSILWKQSNKSNLGKRKELEVNGLLPKDNDIWPNKLQRPLPSSYEVVENGRKSELCTTSTQSVSESVGTVSSHKMNNKASFSCPNVKNGIKLEASNSLKVNSNVPHPHPVMDNGRTLEMCTVGSQFASEWRGTSNGQKADSKVSLFHPVLENGNAGVYQAATRLAIVGHGAIGNQKVNDKEHKINGLIEDKHPNACLIRPSCSPVKVEKNVVESMKPPHPDSKYMSQILNIPSVEWPDMDDQEWLLGRCDLQTNNVRLGSSQVEETKLVWAEALHIESDDMTALPYVIPY